ncbi:acyl-CoA dehydrogenase family protein [Parendozoicomonas haliclonae]|uniref:Acyl-CoA dehydrogenase n=1 Tax=Parendozoicomonas haliclonae TaxID=1960125 RepID=A0A1X7AET5_9GAMM|nr:acyl-CoA dehydrogenase family protein [Parendozoicomonas haliclonae]SMA33902.1 Acyl-CoA dehydrogenase [Parendozoicomonas haliclonae]
MNAIGIALNLANRFAGSDFAERTRLRKPAEKLAYIVTRRGFSAVIKSQGALSKRKAKTNKDKQSQTSQKPSSLFDLNLSEEQMMIKDNAARLAERLREEAASSAIDRKPSEAIWNEFDELGAGYFILPEDLDGMDMAHASETWMLLTEELARGDMGQALALLSPVSVALAISRWGQSGLQHTWQSKLIESGRVQASVAHQETGVNRNDAQPSCTAQKKGNSYRLNGHKTMVPISQSAEFFLVSASLKDKTFLFLVPRNSKGVTVSQLPSMGLHSADLGQLHLKNVDIPLYHCLDAGNFDAQEWLARSQVAAATLATGTAQAILDYVVPYCNDRKAFGEPITHRQSVAFMIADMATEIEGMRLLNSRAASRAERNMDFTKEARLSFLQATSKGMQAGTDGVQLLGGHGFIQEHPVERWYRDLRATPLLAGSLII